MIKNKENFHQNSAAITQPKVENGLSNQLLSNFQTENPCDPNQLVAAVRNELVIEKRVFVFVFCIFFFPFSNIFETRE